MAILANDGHEQKNSGLDYLITGNQNIILKLGDSAGVYSFSVVDVADASIMEVSSDKNAKFHGNIVVEGDVSSITSNDVSIGDSIITLNADIVSSAANSDGGVMIKMVHTSAALVVSSFVNSTGTINITGGPGTLVGGSLIYVLGSENNNGLYEVTSADATTIVVNASSTKLNTSKTLIDETIVASVNHAIPGYIIWNNSSSIIEFGKYNIDGSVTSYNAIGTGSGASDFSTSNPDLSTPGSSNTTSAAHNIGVFNDFTNLVGAKVQILLKAIDTHLTALMETADGIYEKSGIASIGSGVNSIAVTFGTAFANSNYSVVFSLENTTDTTQYTAMLSAKATTGFTVTLSGSTSTVNYKLNWKATKG